jgi:hypothetical protein
MSEERLCYLCKADLCPVEKFGPGYVTVVPGIEICVECLED